MPVFRRVLVANRGEIAVRVIRTLRELGIESIAVYSEADEAAPHVLMADRALCIGPSPASESYLCIDKMLDVVRRTGADAVHPGHGLLSENAEFARAVALAGATFIGPPPDAMMAMARKPEARAAMVAAGLPVVPGGPISEAGTLEYPLLVKASAGGGGKGMRRVARPEDLDEAVAACRREAERAFADSEVYVEHLIERPRHVEIQVLADMHGNCVHLFERDCSVQRRHQKVVEESPSPALSPELRQRMGDAALTAVRAVGYVSAGTVEFLLDPQGRFYFLEMNTRLQVEHPVTEMVVGIDLVAEQIRIAAGEPLGFRQDDLSQRGHAIECRIYAEDPATHLPQTGRIDTLVAPEGPGIRCDSGVRLGQDVTIHYDPMLSKLCAWGPTRQAAIHRAQRALREYVLVGVRTNLPVLRHILRHPVFVAGQATTAFLQDHPYAPPPDAEVPDLAFVAAALARLGLAGAEVDQSEASEGDPHSPWRRLGAWRT